MLSAIWWCTPRTVTVCHAMAGKLSPRPPVRPEPGLNDKGKWPRKSCVSLRICIFSLATGNMLYRNLKRMQVSRRRGHSGCSLASFWCGLSMSGWLPNQNMMESISVCELVPSGLLHSRFRCKPVPVESCFGPRFTPLDQVSSHRHVSTMLSSACRALFNVCRMLCEKWMELECWLFDYAMSNSLFLYGSRLQNISQWIFASIVNLRIQTKC